MDIFSRCYVSLAPFFRQSKLNYQRINERFLGNIRNLYFLDGSVSDCWALIKIQFYFAVKSNIFGYGIDFYQETYNVQLAILISDTFYLVRSKKPVRKIVSELP